MRILKTSKTTKRPRYSHRNEGVILLAY